MIRCIYKLNNGTAEGFERLNSHLHSFSQWLRDDQRRAFTESVRTDWLQFTRLIRDLSKAKSKPDALEALHHEIQTNERLRLRKWLLQEIQQLKKGE